jgi:S-adenosylmethionine:tRNA ribosyltransferase-isomerase
MALVEMKLEECSYDLPEELIAQEPAAARDQSRMMVVNRKTREIALRTFRDISEYLGANDVVVINDSRVFPARLVGAKDSGGLVEILLLSKKENRRNGQTWEVLLRPAKRVAVGIEIFFAEGCFARVADRLSDKKWLLEFTTDSAFDDFLTRFGRAPLPPYIKRKKNRERSLRDLERYQTVYAKNAGSVAAPTAGLHFTHDVLADIQKRDATIVPVTLHVGYGTFLPIETEIVEDHLMEEEFFSIKEETANAVNRAKRVIAVGTTSTRVLESVADERGKVKATSGSTRLFIHPGYRFRRIDALLTNFHLPRSSLFLLVCAFAGRDLMMEAYRAAIENRFRFYSYGDCMFIL